MENDNETVIVAELPGVAKEDVSVTFEGDVLSFGGERKRNQLPENVRVLLNEQKVRSYRRSLRIRHHVDRAAISATLEQGLLRIVLPKVAAVKPRVIEVR
jgi:HSP20 family molecular chaperone IbpA